ncbi:ectoine synthase [Kamptonema sp. UHCC 0994]|uniref:ectoine synthase n=1 Tax=Kamptonema sp. UHCC 0994 TaxID=3031329 RepID=UPI0023B947C9|nr:ectoine synthase [Kamptonema sp. UHCC 0994]MDF0551646.1 ectoine synthase [Kamptonema sp. UHCC 0994]
MIIRSLEEALQTERRVVSETWESTRLLLKADGMGFSFHVTIMYANTETKMWYSNHLEAVFCIEGEGELESLEDGKIYSITPGTLYALDQHDKHIMRAKTQMRIICVFNPPLHGKEIHDEDGSYPLEAEEIKS